MWIDGLEQSPLGPIALAFTARGLCRVAFCRPDELRSACQAHLVEGSAPAALAQAVRQIDSYLSGQQQEFALPIDWEGMSEFTAAARKAAMGIPYGQVRTYGQLAAELGKPAASRAVGAAMASNPMPIVIPCHRVIGADGGLHGYSAPGGLKTKAWLLRLEGAMAQDSFF